jgi:hypothetical protein
MQTPHKHSSLVPVFDSDEDYAFLFSLCSRKVLEAEMASMKEKVTVVLDKSVNDSKLISALKTELLTAAERRSSKGWVLANAMVAVCKFCML